MKKLLFVCVENSCRSQMAEAFAKIHGEGLIEAFSAGSKASGVVNPKAIAAMSEIGYDLSSHASTLVDDLPNVKFDYKITMGCGDNCPYVPASNHEDWQIPDPKNMPPEEFCRIRDIIEAEVLHLLKEIKAENTAKA